MSAKTPRRGAVRKTVPGKSNGAVGSGKPAKGGATSGAIPNQVLKQRTPLKNSTPVSDILPDLGLRRSVPSAYSTGDYGQIEELPLLSTVSDQEDKSNDLKRQKLQQCRKITN
jgi:hypothetical protein